MRKVARQFVFVAVGIIASAAALSRADDVAIDKLPKAVVDALKAKFPGCEITKALSETENDKLVYEVSLKHKGAAYDIIVTPEGTLNVIEKAIEPKDLPKPVVEALHKKYPNAKVDLAEELSDGSGKITSYEVHFTADGKKVAIEFAPDGKIVSEESRTPPAQRWQTMIIRSEQTGDREAIDAVHRLSFPISAEAERVGRLRDAEKLVISLVAKINRTVVGHVAFNSVSPAANHGEPFSVVGCFSVPPAASDQVLLGGRARI